MHQWGEDHPVTVLKKECTDFPKHVCNEVGKDHPIQVAKKECKDLQSVRWGSSSSNS